jgi:hypothetical protein
LQAGECNVLDIVRPFAFRTAARVTFGAHVDDDTIEKLRTVYDDVLAKGLLAPNGTFVPGAEDAATECVATIKDTLRDLFQYVIRVVVSYTHTHTHV